MLWTLITTGSFSNIDTAHTDYIKVSAHTYTLNNYSLSRSDTFKEITMWSTDGHSTMIDLTTTNSKYLDSIKHYFVADLANDSVGSEYTLHDDGKYGSYKVIRPIVIDSDRKVIVLLRRSVDHEDQIALMIQPKNYRELMRKFADSLRRADSIKYGARIGDHLMAEKLTDSAIYRGPGPRRIPSDSTDTLTFADAAKLLNKAIAMDSSYIEAYNIKIEYERELKQYDSVIVTGKKILKLSPDRIPILHRIGECYEITGKTDSAKIYYEKALVLYNKRLTGLSKHDFSYIPIMINKALALIMLGREQEGRAIFKKLSDDSTEEHRKHIYQVYLNTPRKELVSRLNP